GDPALNSVLPLTKMFALRSLRRSMIMSPIRARPASPIVRSPVGTIFAKRSLYHTVTRGNQHELRDARQPVGRAIGQPHHRLRQFAGPWRLYFVSRRP